MRPTLKMLLPVAVLALGACHAHQASGDPDSFENSVDQQEDDATEDEQDDEVVACRTALDCAYRAGERCQLTEPALGLCVVPENLEDPWMRMGPAGQPPPPLVGRSGGMS